MTVHAGPFAAAPQAAHGVARPLIKVLPNVTVVELADLGRMGPITDPDLVNRAIEDFMLSVL
jgi:hypothetical protein